MNLISPVPRSRRFGFPISWPFDAFLGLFFAAAWLTPLTSEVPKMTLITLPCLGGEAGVVIVGWLVASLLRRLLALSERNSRRFPFFSSSLTFIFSVTQSSAFWPWSLWKSHHRLGFQKESGAFIFWCHLAYWSICLTMFTSPVSRWRGEKCWATWTLSSIVLLDFWV